MLSKPEVKALLQEKDFMVRHLKKKARHKAELLAWYEAQASILEVVLEG